MGIKKEPEERLRSNGGEKKGGTEKIEEWTGIIVREEHYVTEGTWVWGDAHCKTRKRENYLHRIFYTNPPPPVSNDLFKVRTRDGEDVICYSANGCLFAKDPVILTETRYSLTIWDKLKSLLGL